jgi:hypothetical protein
MTAEAIARALNGRRCGQSWMAPCPAHDDHHPSLSITERHGRLLVHCHAGCPQAAVIKALRGCGLWAEQPAQPAPNRPKPEDEWLEWRPGVRYPAAWGRIVREYVYQDADGEPLYSVFRTEPKNFRQGYRNAAGSWIWYKHPQQLPYRLPLIVDAKFVFVCEGEKDVNALAEWGFTATCNAGGAGKWRAEWGPLFAGKTIIIIPDADEPGRAHARQVAEALLPHAQRVILLPLPDGTKDIYDYFEGGGSEVWLCQTIDRLLTATEVRIAA